MSDGSLNSWIEVSQDNVLKIVLKINNLKSLDFYGLSVYLLKGIIEGIFQTVTMLVKQCLSSGTFPDALKIARTVPVLKKGDPDDTKSIRSSRFCQSSVRS